MELERAVGLIALGWLIGSVLLMARSIRIGRALAEALASRHPSVYEALGRPLPGYLESVRRTRFAQFVARREFEKLADGALSAEFEAYRRSEARLMAGVLTTGGMIALIGLAMRHSA
jgi:hypothetical protein